MPQNLKALRRAKIVLPDRTATGQAVLLSGDRIEAVLPDDQIPSDAEIFDLDGLTITPGFIDLQVNGGGGLLLNDQPDAEAMRVISEAHGQFGTTSLLPTLISDEAGKSESALRAVQEAIDARVPGVMGLHLEGPFLAAAKKGIHNDKHFRRLSSAEASTLRPPRGGKLLLTLAPEQHSAGLLRQLTAQGVILSAGHTEASFDETRSALMNGLLGFTHLFNAMPPLLSREPGPVAAALESEAWCMVIADGHHVDPAMLRLAIRAKSDGRMILVSDSMSLVGTEQRSFQFDGKTIYSNEGRLTDEAGTLAGSTLTMLDAVRYAHDHLGLALHQAVRMATYEPARFLGLEDRLGRIRAGCTADLNIFAESINLLATIRSGDLNPVLPHFR
jgi:N-acetylglucosamine-6-phosphate deacetylase